MSQAFGDNTMSECIARHWFYKFRSWDPAVAVLDNEVLKTTIVKDDSQTCNEHAKRFRISDETNFICTAQEKRTIWASEYPTDCWMPTRNNRVIACFSSHSRQHNVPIFNGVLISDEKRVRHRLSSRDNMPYTTRECQITSFIYLEDELTIGELWTATNGTNYHCEL